MEITHQNVCQWELAQELNPTLSLSCVFANLWDFACHEKRREYTMLHFCQQNRYKMEI